MQASGIGNICSVSGRGAGGMPKGLYLVIHSRDRWWIDFEGAAQGPFETRESAALEARSLAQFKAHTGRECEVMVPDDRGRYSVVWSSQYDTGGSRDSELRRASA